MAELKYDYEPGTEKNHSIKLVLSTHSDGITNQVLSLEEFAHDGTELTVKQMLITDALVSTLQDVLNGMGRSYIEAKEGKPKAAK